MSLEKDLKKKVDRTVWVVKRCLSLEQQINEEPLCNLQHKLDVHVEELRDIMNDIKVLNYLIQTRDLLADSIGIQRKN